MVPPMLLGSASLETVRQRADYLKAMAGTMGLDPLLVADSDLAAQRLIIHDRLRAMGAL